MTSTGELLAAADRGDQSAWDELVDRFGRLVWAVIRGYRLDDATASDVSQTVWLRLVENTAKIRNPDRLAAWLATTARNESVRVLKRRGRHAPMAFEFDAPDPLLPDPDDKLIQAEESRALLVAMEDLKPECRQLLQLLVTEPPLDYEAISEMIDRPIGSIGPTRARCPDRLRKIMGAQGANGPLSGKDHS